jgi:hypothetical protein
MFFNCIRLQSQPTGVRPPRRQQQGAKNPLRQIQATIPTADEYTEVHTNISEQELRRLKRAQSKTINNPVAYTVNEIYFYVNKKINICHTI